MTNFEKYKYKTSEERDDAFHDFCYSHEECESCPLGRLDFADSSGSCFLDWLELDCRCGGVRCILDTL